MYPHDDPGHQVIQRVKDGHLLAPRDLGFPGRHRIIAAGMEGMAPGDTRHREPEPAGRTVFGQGGEGVRAAGWLEPAARPEQRADEPPVSRDGEHQQPGRHRTLVWRGADRTVISTYRWMSNWHYRRAPQPAAAATC